MKLIVCNSCEAEFKITHHMDEHHYEIAYCPFCSESVKDPDFVDDIEWDEMDE